MSNESVTEVKYLNKISAQRYKNLDLEQALELNPHLNIFIGPNGAGKSNIISLLQLFNKSLFDSNSLSSQQFTPLMRELFNLGSGKILSIYQDYPSTVDFSLDFSAFRYDSENDSKTSISYLYLLDLLCLSESEIPFVSRELLFKQESNNLLQNLYKISDSKQKSKTFIPFHGQENNHDLPFESFEVPNNELFLNILPLISGELKSLPKPPEFNDMHQKLLIRGLHDTRRQILNFVSDWRFYSANEIRVQDVRKSEPEIGAPAYYLDPNFENLASVVENLFQESYKYEESLNLIVKDFLPNTAKIRPIRLGRTKLGIEWNIRGVNRPLYLSDMSDGTLRMLCWAVLLNSPHLPSLLVLDEPEIGIHIEWFKYLAHWIKTASQKTQIILITHSPDLLDKFTDSIDKVRVFEPSQNKGLFHVKHLSQEILQVRLDEGWELGDMYRIGEPEVGGWSI